MLVRITQGEVCRRGPRLRVTGPELDDLAYQAAADALLAITGKLGQFRGEIRFMTWAYKFVIFEVSAKIGRHSWRHPGVPLDAEDWDRLPDRFGFDSRAVRTLGGCWPHCAAKGTDRRPLLAPRFARPPIISSRSAPDRWPGPLHAPDPGNAPAGINSSAAGPARRLVPR